jgi:predicted ArsR family transcriptional regulator
LTTLLTRTWYRVPGLARLLGANERRVRRALSTLEEAHLVRSLLVPSRNGPAARVYFLDSSTITERGPA